MKVEINRKEYAISLSWLYAENINEAKSLQKELGSPYGVFKQNKKDNRLSRVGCASSEDQGVPSLAAILSYKYENLIFVTDKFNIVDEKTGLPQYWFCVIQNGSVNETGGHEVDADISVEGDAVFTRDQLIESYKNISEYLIAKSDDLQIIADVEDETLLTEELLGAEYRPDALVEILSSSDKLGKKVVIRKLKGFELNNFQAGVIAFIAVIILGGVAYHLIDSGSNENVSMTPQQRVALEREQKAQFFEGVVGELKRSAAENTLISVHNAIEGLPRLVNGWQLISVGYDGQTPDKLSLYYMMQRYSSLSDLSGLKSKLNVDTVRIGPQGKQAVLSIKIPTYSEENVNITKSQLSNKNKLTQYKINLISQLQNYSLNYDFGKPNTLRYGLETQKVTIKGKSLYGLLALQNASTGIPVFAVEDVKVSVSLDGNYLWEVTGKIYE